MKIEVILGDLLNEEADAIVNPANCYLVMAGGVAGAIKKRGGSLIEEEARGKAPVKIGQAIITEAGRLPAKNVIHAPTMEIPGKTYDNKVYDATRGALLCAKENNLKSISFPCMGCGVGGVFPKKAAKAMLKAFEEEGRDLKIRIVAYNQESYNAFSKVMGE